MIILVLIVVIILSWIDLCWIYWLYWLYWFYWLYWLHWLYWLYWYWLARVWIYRSYWFWLARVRIKRIPLCRDNNIYWFDVSPWIDPVSRYGRFEWLVLHDAVYFPQPNTKHKLPSPIVCYNIQLQKQLLRIHSSECLSLSHIPVLIYAADVLTAHHRCIDTV